MSAPSWLSDPPRVTIVPVEPAGVEPRLVDASANAIRLESAARRVGFVPEWIPGPGDAGEALLRLFGAQVQPLASRINRLPEKALAGFLRMAGIEQLPGTTASALLAFEATAGAPEPAQVPAGFQVAATPADGSPGLVVFETTRAVSATPGTIEAAGVLQNRLLLAIDDVTEGAAPFLPFGDRPIAGRAFVVGILSSVAPRPTITLGIVVAAAPGAPPPATAGGLQPAPVARPPILQWEAFDRGQFTPAAVIVDETGGLARSGIVELQVPRDWRAARLPASADERPLFWLRVRIVHGAFAEPPQLARVILNAARAEAAETIRDEVVEHVPGSDDRMRLARTPVLPGSLVVEIFEGAATGDLDGEDERTAAGAGEAGVRQWREVADLAAYGPADRVFTLDPGSGELAFGDGQHGMTLPRGFRHVTARRYRVGGGEAGAVAADQVSTLVQSVPFLRGVTNPERAAGGGANESRAEAILRGPDEIRARGRAVTERDYELLARRARGAAVARARAVSGLHPLLPGKPLPGVVGVFVVPALRENRPPIADEQTLKAVADFLAAEAAPAGVEVVTAAARIHTVRAEARVVVSDPATDAGKVVRQVIDQLNRYFDPVRGGDDGQGWPFGAAIRYVPLQRRLLTAVSGLSAIERISLILDGTRFRSCTDVPLSPYGLLWPGTHEVTVEVVERRP